MDLTKLSKESLIEFENQITAELESRERKNVLTLVVKECDLIICLDNDINKRLGEIGRMGSCFILSTVRSQHIWELWMSSGMNVDNTMVDWNNKKYKINNEYKLVSNYSGDYIYDFKLCRPATNCMDSNIQRYLNGTPKIF